MTMFKVENTDYSKILSDLNITVAHTYTGDIKRTLKGKVTSFPVSYRTIGVNVILIGTVVELTKVLNQVQVNKVKLDFTDTVYVCSGGIYSCTEAAIERLDDRKDKMGKMTIDFVSVGIPSIVPGATTVTLLAPDNT